MSKNNTTVESRIAQVRKDAPAASSAANRTEFSKKGANAPARPGVNSSLGRRALSLFLAVLLGVSGALVDVPGLLMRGAVEPVYADDLVNTVPNEETPTGNNFYSGTINTGFVPNGYTLPATYGPGYGPYTVPGVYQSQSTASPTSFAAGLPLGTIFIDQEMIKTKRYEVVAEVVSKNTEIIAGLNVNCERLTKLDDNTEVITSNTVGYDGTRPGARKMVPGIVNELKGDLFTVTFKNAAVLPNGDRANLVITYSNARIVIDERYMAAPDGNSYCEVANDGSICIANPQPTSSLTSTDRNHTYRDTQYQIYTDGEKDYIKPDINDQYYHGAVYLSQGNAFSYGGDDKTDMSVTYGDAGANIVNKTASENFEETYAKPVRTATNNNNNVYPATGLTMDATCKIVNENGVPVEGTYVFAITGINLDRDPDVGGSNNSCKPLWYSALDSFDSGKGKEHSFFSEAMEIRGGQAADYVYVRPNTGIPDNPAEQPGVKGQYFWPNVGLHNGNIKFIGNAVNSPSLGGSDPSYGAGFVTLADAANGFQITASGHGTHGQGMNSFVFGSKQIWYRYTSGSGKHGKIETTSEGNWGGTLSDSQTILDGGENPYAEGATGSEKPNVYVVTEGKTVTYTMTPDIGYKMKKLTVNGEEVKFENESVSKMKKGDTVTVTTKAGHEGVLTYKGDGTYTFIFPYAEHDEEIFVEWEPVTADLLISKVWKDEDDIDGLRKLMYGEGGTPPKFRLEYSINGGKSWDPVENNSIENTTIKPARDYTDGGLNTNPIDVPSGLDETSGKYLDGTYVLNNGQTGSREQNPAVLPVDPSKFELVPRTKTTDHYPVYKYTGSGSHANKLFALVNGSYHEFTPSSEPALIAKASVNTVAADIPNPQPATVPPQFGPAGLTRYGQATANEQPVYQDASGNLYVYYNLSSVRYRKVNRLDNPAGSNNGAITGGNVTLTLSDLELHKVSGVQQTCTGRDVLKHTNGNLYIVNNATGYAYRPVDPVTGLDVYGTTGGYAPDPTPATEFDKDNTYTSGFKTTRDTCDGEPVLLDPRTGKRYVKEGNDYYEVKSEDHPFTWEYLPVYTYDSNGTADRLISYRIVEIEDPVHRDYKDAQFFDAQAFELTSETSKSWDGWLIYEDKNDPSKRYVKKGDGRYYVVSRDPSDPDKDGIVSDTPVSEEDEPNKDDLKATSSNAYRTADKAIPYQSAEILNEHTVRKLYVDVNKFWNDKELKKAITTGVNEYERVELKFILHGATEDGDVDLNGDTTEGKDLELTVSPTEDGAKYVKIDNYQIYKDPIGNQYAQVIDHATAENGYYPVSEGAIDYTKAADVKALDLSPVINTQYKVDDDNFGVCFNELPTHEGGKNITYTVKEQFKIGDTWYDAGESEVSWITNGGALNPERDSSQEVKGYETKFSNTPRIEDKYVTLPITIAKRDAKTTNILLEGAEFTIYRNAITEEKALDNDDVKIEGQKIYTNGSLEYVLRQEAGDTEEKYYTFEGHDDNNDKVIDRYTYTLANPQPKETDLKVKQGDVKSNVVYTKTDGTVMVEFQEPGTYYIKETKAPTGYTADPAIYAFIVNEDLKTITLEDADEDHATSWWQKLYDMLFGDDTAPTTYTNWDSDRMILTVDNEPLKGSVLVRKIWEDNDDQDGLRPEDGETTMPVVILEWTTAAHTAKGQPVFKDENGTTKYVYNTADKKYYEVTEEDKPGSYETSAASTQPDKETLTESTETCQGRTVYTAGTNKYVLVDGAYHAVNAVDTEGTISGSPADKQPKEEDLTLIMDEGSDWQTMKLDDGTGTEKDAKESVTHNGGPVRTDQHEAYTWNNVPAYQDGKVIVYRINETSTILDDGTYTIKYSHTSDTHEKVFTLVDENSASPKTLNQTIDVTNKHVTQVINIEAYKTWDDEDKTKRQETTLTLYKTVNGARSAVTLPDSTDLDQGTVLVTDETDPVKTWKNLPMYENGHPITYSIVEKSVNGYETEYEVAYTDVNGDAVDKKLDAIDVEDVKREFYTEEDEAADLIPDDKEVGDEKTTAAFKITNKEIIFRLSGTKKWIGGEEEYHVNGSVTLDNDGNITAATDALGLQLWRDYEKDATTGTVTKDELGRDIAIVWVKETRTTNEGVTTVTREKQETGNGTYTVKAIDPNTGAYVDPFLLKEDSEGYKYTYYIKEVNVPENYVASYYDEHGVLTDKGLHISNKDNETDTIKVTKHWDDAQDADGIRPEKVIVHLYKIVDVVLTEAEKAAAAATVNQGVYDTDGSGDLNETEQAAYDAAVQTAIAKALADKTKAESVVQVEVAKREISYKDGEDTDEDTWDSGVIWTDLPRYDDNGSKIQYIVTEETVAGYTATYSKEGGEYIEEGDSTLLIVLDGDKTTQQTIDIKNSLIPATNKVEVTKIWDDQNDIDGARPDDVTFQLYKYVWDKTANGGKGAYKTTEELVSGDSGTGRPATKADVDADKEAKEAAGEISTMKVGDIIKIEDLTLDGTADDPTDTFANETAPTDDNTWKGEWINLPLTENGKTVLYIIKEVIPDGTDSVYGAPGTQGKYSNEPCIHGDQIKGYTVTNEYTPEVTEFVGIKSWVDGDPSITHNNSSDLAANLTLWRTNVAPADWTDETAWTSLGTLDNLNTTLAPNAHVDWSTATQKDDTFTISGLAKKDGDGKTYYYKVTESEITGYATTYLNAAATEASLKEKTDALYSGGTVENAAKTGEIIVKKKFVDEDGNVISKKTLPGDFKIKVTYVWNNPETKKFEEKTEELKIGADQTADDDGFYTWTRNGVAYGTKVTAGEIGYDSPTGYSYVSTTADVSGDSGITHTATNPTYAEFMMPSAAATANPELRTAVNQGETASIAFTNTYSRDTGKIEPVKIWNDNSNAAGKRPDTVTFTITAKSTDLSKEYDVFDDGQGGKTSSMTYTFAGAGVGEGDADMWTMNEGWDYQIEGLLTHTDDGEKIKYVVEEKDADVPDDYLRIYSQGDIYIELSDGAVEKAEITNIYKYTEINVTKKWIGKPEADVTIKLLADDGTNPATEVASHVFTTDELSGGAYTYTFTKKGEDNSGTELLDRVTADGKEIVYTVQEVDGNLYDAEIVKTASGEWIVTNTGTYIDIAVRKVWEDKDDHDGLRPDSISIKLKQNGSDYSATGFTNPAVLNDGNNWTYIFRELPRKDATGSAYVYSVEESAVPDYSVSYFSGDSAGDKTDGTVGSSGEVIITNRHIVATEDVVATKVWDDGAAGSASMHTDVVLHLYGTNANGRILYDAGVKKIEMDADGQPLDANGNPVVATWTDLPSYHYSNEELQWMIVEEAVPGYSSTVEKIDANTFKVTNTYDGLITKVTVEKDWQDNDNVDGKRPSTVSYQLMKKVGDKDAEPVGDAVEAVETPASPATDATGQLAKWGYQWTDLPTTEEVDTQTTETVDRLGVETRYRNINDETDDISAEEYDQLPDSGPTKLDFTQVTEDVPADPPQWINADGTVTLNDEDYQALSPEQQAEYVPVMVTRPVDPAQYVNNNDPSDVRYQDGYDQLPDSGPTKLDYEPYDKETKMTEDVPVYETMPVIYWVEEVYTGTDLEANGYKKPVIESLGGGAYKAINTRDRDTKDLEIVKVWSDNDDVDGVRPDHVAFELKTDDGNTIIHAGEKTIANILVGEENGWKVVIHGVPVNQDGQISEQVKYIVKELNVPRGYEAAYSSEDASGVNLEDGTIGSSKKITVINTHTPGATMTFRAIKKWQDSDGTELSSQPHEVKFRLIQVHPHDGTMRDMGDAYERIIPAGAEGDDLIVIWTGLPATVNLQTVTYTVEEEPVDGYTTTMLDGVENPEPGIDLEVTVINKKHIITVTYKEPAAFNDEIIQGPDEIDRDQNEPDAPADPVHEGYTFMGWTRTEDASGNVVYTAKYAEIPEVVEPVKVTYLDPKAADGSMILKATKYNTSAEANDEAKNKSEKPADPSHPNYDFVGWVANQDEFGDWIIVAKYNEKLPEPENKKTTSYIDPVSGKLIKSEITDDPSSVEPPTPTAYENMQFVEWAEIVDANGNTVFVAKYASDCRNTPAPPPSAPEEPPYVAPVTGDDNNMMLWILLAIAALAMMTIVVVVKRRNRSR